MAESLTLQASDGHQLSAYFTPATGEPRGGLVVIHEFLGITPYILSVCEDYAADGYSVLAPALYDRQVPGVQFDRSPEDMQRAAEIRKGLQWNQVLADVDAARKNLEPFGRCGIIGFCMGGSVAWLAAHALPFAASISYYGKDVPDWLDKTPKYPIIVHFGESDNLIPLPAVEKVRAAFPGIPVHVYPAGHAFDNPAHGADRSIAALARARSLSLLRTHIG